MGIMAYSFLWVMQDFVHQPYQTNKHPRLLPCISSFDENDKVSPLAWL